MRIEKILKIQQPDIYKQLRQQNSKNKQMRRKQEHLSFSDYMELMKHDSYERHRGAVRRK